MSQVLRPAPEVAAVVDAPRDHTRPVRPARTRAQRRDRTATVVAAVAIGLGALWLYAQLRDTSFFFDEWDVLLRRRELDPTAFLRSHNGHLIVVPVLAYRTLLAVFGADSYRPFLVFMLAVHAGLAFSVFLVARRYANVVVGACAAAVVLLLGRGGIEFVWVFQTTFLLSTLGAVITFLALEKPGRARSFIAMGGLALALGSSGIGIPVVVGAACRIAVDRSSWRRAWVLVPPVVAYGAWYLVWGESSAQLSNLHLVPAYMLRAASAAAGAVVGVDELNGRYVVGAGVAALCVVVIARRSISNGAVMFGVIALTFWGVTGLSRAQFDDPDTPRYLFVGAVLVVLFAATLWDRRAVPWYGTTTVVILTALSLWGNLPYVHDHIDGQKLEATYQEAGLGALEMMRGDVDALFIPDLQHYPQVTADDYFDMIDEYGSQADSPAEIRAQSPAVRAATDLVIARAAVGDNVAEPFSQACPNPAAVTQGVPDESGEMVLANPGPGEAAVEIQLFADSRTRLVTLAPGTAVDVVIPDGVRGPDFRIYTVGDVVSC